MRQYSLHLLFLFSAIALLSSSNIIIENNCLRSIYVYQHGYFGNDTFECIIPRDEICKLNYDDDFVGFKVRQKKDDEPKSLTEISINQFHSGTDYYGINLSRGFDLWVSIEPLAENSTKIICRDINCPGALRDDKESRKRLATKTGGTFRIVYCA
ncbi:unnamed protein product [Bursaphelenchus xylophilus]|uniref:(pine wood nematode) hypothetical protein n=1 Tax=Bursaphelenchus xylophilus TaxID=6326 RepID=A0A1I7RUA3_BURXY|nr:unnamed protein product [Bursaphelenchus xylophilus]CAG9113977.1 unnamed protein product [Bursaphelenchus xylophilus]